MDYLATRAFNAGTLCRRSSSGLAPDDKPAAPPAPEDLYDAINGRYEQGSILLTSNRALDERADLFGDPLLASAGLDRLTHHS